MARSDENRLNSERRFITAERAPFQPMPPNHAPAEQTVTGTRQKGRTKPEIAGTARAGLALPSEGNTAGTGRQDFVLFCQASLEMPLPSLFAHSDRRALFGGLSKRPRRHLPRNDALAYSLHPWASLQVGHQRHGSHGSFTMAHFAFFLNNWIDNYGKSDRPYSNKSAVIRESLAAATATAANKHARYTMVGSFR